jgi:hypothetical protein
MTIQQTTIADRWKCACGCTQMIIGQAFNIQNRRIYPFVCVECGTVQQQYEKKTVALAEAKRIGRDLPEVKTSTQANMKIWNGLIALKQSLVCEVCQSNDDIQRHHWAPYHLFGEESKNWPTSLLCQSCHDKWHKIVTPNMSHASPRP